MKRTGIRARTRPAIDWPARGDYRRVLPFRRSWIAIVIIAASDAIFLYPSITVFRQAASEWGRFEHLFDLVSALFLSAWLLGWSLAPLLLTTVLVMLLFGREVIGARPGAVELFIGIPGLGVRAEYDISHMRNWRREVPPAKSGKSWRGPHLAFDYGANSIEAGSDLAEHEVSGIRNQVETAAGRVIRRGEATPEELEGRWEPGGLAAEPPDPPATVVHGAIEPLTLASPSTVALVLANLVPLAGAAFLGWRLSDVMVLYWAESAVIGFFNICKMAAIGRWMAIPAGLFFLGHFGAFMAVHFLFLYGLFVEGPRNTSGGDLREVAMLFLGLWPALAILFASHALSFWVNFIRRGEYAGRSLQKQMQEPYSRIIFMHLVLIFGGGLTLVLGEPTPVLLVVIALKIWFDIRAHLKQHGGSPPLARRMRS